MTLTRQQFILKVAPYVLLACEGTNYFPSVFLAQAILESGNGNSGLSTNYYNYFGIKAGTAWKGKIVNMKTREVFNGKDTVIKDGFRVYDSIEEGFKDRVKFLQQNGRYNNLQKSLTAFEQCEQLQEDHYATDPNYAHLLKEIITDSNLSTYDLKKKI